MRRAGDRTCNWPPLLFQLLLMVALFSPILFTDKIVRAPDILNEFYWGVYNAYGKPLWSLLRIDLSSAGWDPYINSGHTNDGGMVSTQFLYLYRLIFGLIPAPASVAWFMVLHLFLGGVGTFLYCRLIGCSRTASLLGGMVFALCTENVSLINAGHVMKIATIAHAPFVFYFLEKGFRSNRWFPYLCASLALALQFFNTHWQIAFYTCLAVGVYVIIRLLSGLLSGESAGELGRPLLMAIGMTLFFLAASAISLAPLSSWARDTNRGVQSGANQGKGGLDREEAMMWSMPPEEVASLVIPGLFGLSRQEGGDQPKAGHTYYWGRMVFTQTASYFGLLPWLLLPLPLIFRNDRITKAALVAVLGGILFSMGKYTPFYQLLYEYLPGIDRFRVPKMMLFITALGLAVLAARGMDLLRDDSVCRSPRLKAWTWWLLAFPLCLTLLLATETFAGGWIRGWLMELLARPTRYQAGVELVTQRWFNIERETGLALAFAAFQVLLLLALVRVRMAVMAFLAVLLAVFTLDLWRVNRPFLVLTDSPVRTEQSLTPAMQWIREQQGHGVVEGKGLEKSGKQVPEYRVLPLGDGDPMRYAAAGIPVLYTSNAVQKRRWQEYLDSLTLQGRLPDMLNIRWLVCSEQQYGQLQAGLDSQRYRIAFKGGGELVLENRQVLPKAWLTPAVQVVDDPAMLLKKLAAPGFDPQQTSLVESPPPFPLRAVAGGKVRIERLEAERIILAAETPVAALLVLGEKYHQGWRATINGVTTPTVPVNNVLRGIYLPPGGQRVEFRFDPLPFRIGKWITCTAFLLFGLMAAREWLTCRKTTHD